MPRQEEPAGVLALVPEALLMGLRWQRFALPPKRVACAVVGVNGRLIAPARRILNRTRPHLADAFRVPLEHRIPLVRRRERLQ